MGLYYLPFWLEVWYKDYKVQALPRNTRLILYDLLFIMWDKDMFLDNDDAAISYYMRITQEEWIDAKRILLKHGFIKTISAGKRLISDRLAAEYDRVLENKELQSNRAKKGWTTRKNH